MLSDTIRINKLVTASSEIKTLDDKSIKVTPNPVKNGLLISGIKPETEIYNLNGQLIKHFSGNTTDMSAFPKGMYFIRSGEKQAKFIKE